MNRHFFFFLRKSSWKSSSHQLFHSYTHFKSAYSFSSTPPPTPAPLFFFRVLKEKPSLQAFSCKQEAKQELVCFLRGSDIFALQEVQLQHRHQIVPMLDWFGLSSLCRRAWFLQMYHITQSHSNRSKEPVFARFSVLLWQQGVTTKG